MPTRYIAIGDIHGCAVEFERLLERLAPTASDQIILLGDLVNKGPDTPRVFDLARECKAICLLGNHELRLLEYRRSRNLSLLKPEDLPTLYYMRPSDWEIIEAMKLTHYVPEIDTIFVHGGFLPDLPWQDQPAEIVTRIQVVDRLGRPRKRKDAEGGVLWADKWLGPSYVVYGHTPRPEIYETPFTQCLDTACVMGGKLSALVLPSRLVVQVRARQKYWQT